MNKHKFAANLSRVTIDLHFPVGAFKVKAGDALKFHWHSLSSIVTWPPKMHCGECWPVRILIKIWECQEGAIPMTTAMCKIPFYFDISLRVALIKKKKAFNLKATPPSFLPRALRTQLAIVTSLTNGRETNSGGVYSRRRIQWSHMPSSAL